MIDFIGLFQISFFSAFVSCGLAILRNTKFPILKYIYLCAFFTAFIFNGLNSITDTFIAGFAAGLTAAVSVGLLHLKGKHSYLFIVIPVIYCIGPGGAMYKLFLMLFNRRFSGIVPQLIYILKDAIGIWFGVVSGTRIINIMTQKDVQIIS